MATHIPFVNGLFDCRLVWELYSDAKVVRVPLERAGKLLAELPKEPKVWLDPGIDGFHRPLSKSSKDWQNYVAQYPGYESIADEEFQSKPDSGQVEEFVTAVLDACNKQNPIAISVPQLPIVNDASRNRINKSLAAATAKWKSASKYRGRLVLPVIFTDQRQLNLKTERNKKRPTIRTCWEKSEANVLWAVDSSLSDQSGSDKSRSHRFPGLVNFHEEIQEALPKRTPIVAGPYWGMNLVLWVRGLCRSPAIGLGSAYQYHIAGGHPQSAVNRVAIPPLRRWVRAVPQFRDWLSKAMQDLGPSDAAYAAFAELKGDLATLTATKDASRRQIARFYKQWFDELETVPPAGRALALYKMLSAAYVLGKTLPRLAPAERTARRPERIAEHLMLNCL
ncbi:MAG: hypothetical protein HQ582_04605 [Planctomycetes bacterium]|nr:hypothetical protein [Planctomycetota bacterium]